jgi:hypothetical protein
MRKSDHLLREIYKELDKHNTRPGLHTGVRNILLKSSVFPASIYGEEFYDFQHVLDVANNNQNNTIDDILILLHQAVKLWKARSAKVRRVPDHFYEYVHKMLYRLELATYGGILDRDYKDLPNDLLERVESEFNSFKNKFGFERQHEQIREYYIQHELSPDIVWSKPDALTDDQREAVKKFRAFEKTIRLRAIDRLYAFLYSLSIALEKIVKQS